MRVSLVIGRAGGTWQDVAAAERLVAAWYGPFDEVIAVNDSGHDYPRVDHWVSFHGDKFEGWKRIREERGFPPVGNYWTSTYGRLESVYERRLGQLGVKKINYTGGGSSGLVAALLGISLLRSSHVILAGIPMDAGAGHYNSSGPWKEAAKHRGAWEAKLEDLMPRVRSMSGWTAAVLGEPDPEWLAEVHEIKEVVL